MTLRYKRAAVARSQRGTALLVAMIMIFMMAIMGATAMRGSTLERRMASNAIQARSVNQAAESMTELLLNDDANLTAAFTAAANAPSTAPTPAHEITRTEQQDIGFSSDGDLTYVGSGAAPGFSFGTFEALRFIAEGSSTIATVGASSVIEQGAFRPVPGTN